MRKGSSFAPVVGERRVRLPLVFMMVLGMVTALCAGISTAALTSPTEGQVYRQGPVPINESVGGQFFKADGVTTMSSAERTTCTFRSTTFPNARTARGLVVGDPSE